ALSGGRPVHRLSRQERRDPHHQEAREHGAVRAAVFAAVSAAVRVALSAALLAVTAAAAAPVVYHRGNTGDPYTLDPQRSSATWESHVIRDLFIGLVVDDARGEPV